MKDRLRGFTLLEVILALSLTVVVMSAVGTAIHLHLRSLDVSRVGIERDQLARTIMRRIADDIRGAVRYEPFDGAGMEAIGKGANDAMSALMGEVGRAEGENGESGGASGSGVSRQSSGRGRATSNTTASAAAKSNRSEGESEDDSATTEAPAPVPGVYGNELQLQLDIGRIPRPDEFASAGMAGYTPASDVRTVSYYVTVPGATAAPEGGLLRSEMNRAEAMYLWDQGDPSQLEERADLLAAEVAGIRFAYFDGTDFYPEWDTAAMGGLPIAVEIELTLMDPVTKQPVGVSGMVETDSVYRMLVHLPNGGPFTQGGSASGSSTGDSESSDSSSQQDPSSGSASGSGGGGTGGTGGGGSGGGGGGGGGGQR
jgi:prepilin-type N-terminal cleavage/methylation domain-containing protein